MNRYWDLTTKQKSELTQEDVRALIKIELMEKGVVAPPQPELLEVPKVREPEKVTLHAVRVKERYSDEIFVAFESEADALAFMKMPTFKINYDYSIGSEYKYAEPLTNKIIEIREFYSYADVTSMAAELREAKAVEESNQKAQREFAEANKAVEEASKDLWEDWSESREIAQRMNKIKSTLDDYVETAGDEETAMKFLEKAYSSEDIKSMREWFE